jgi:hypothetical protein
VKILPKILIVFLEQISSKAKMTCLCLENPVLQLWVNHVSRSSVDSFRAQSQALSH